MELFVDKECKPIYPGRWVYEEVQYPDRIFTEWGSSQLSSVGIYKVVVSDFTVPEGKEVVDYTYQIKGEIAEATPVFGDKVVDIPQTVSRAQGKAALLQSGLLGLVEAYIEGLSGEEKTLALISFNDTTEWRRNSPFLLQAAKSLGMSEEILDNLFLLAESIIL